MLKSSQKIFARLNYANFGQKIWPFCGNPTRNTGNTRNTYRDQMKYTENTWATENA